MLYIYRLIKFCTQERLAHFIDHTQRWYMKYSFIGNLHKTACLLICFKCIKINSIHNPNHAVYNNILKAFNSSKRYYYILQTTNDFLTIDMNFMRF